MAKKQGQGRCSNPSCPAWYPGHKAMCVSCLEEFKIEKSKNTRFARPGLIHLGAWGKTIFSLRPAVGLEGDRLELRVRSGAIDIGAQEIEAIMALGEACGLEAHHQTIHMMKERLRL